MQICEDEFRIIGMNDGKKVIELSEICELITKGTTPTTLGYKFQKEGINFLKVECFDEEGNFIPDKIVYISEECNEKLKRSQLKQNDILFSIAGAIGRVMIVSENMLPANTNQALAIIRINKDNIFVPYIRLILTSEMVKRQYEKQKQGVAQLNLSLKNIGDLRIPICSLEQQVRYVDIFENLEQLIHKRKTELRAYDILIKSRFVEMFGDTVENPMEWPVKKLGDLSLQINSGNTPKGGEQVYVDKGITFFRSQNVWKDRLEMDDIAYIDESTHAGMSRSSLKHGDILMTKTGRINTENSSLGRAALYMGEDDAANVNGHVYFIRLRAGVSNKFILRILVSDEYRDYIRSVCVGGIDKRQLNKDHFENFPIICPPESMVEEYIKFVEQIDKLRFATQKSLTETQQLFDSLMQKYFG
ncbi:restriction endonuclease subunit S [Schaedlerella arabinosiphila]|uniref:Restriction endonuclease subunit S n=1 Tax=Schaedlerella arabinosiphila TaxID=2044587 RepID=A0A9X5CAK0_9FIRM|nr:restriction endonuclease subunit S [Schaedlerella arabinosiphila]NDO71054.1 restriction endonuclease subunit S [Schaedlerella arabinosiphila]